MEKSMTQGSETADHSDSVNGEYMYDPLKASQIIAYLALKGRDRSIDMLKAIKLLYIAEREHMRRYAIPMLDEPRAALPNGPVNSFTYDRVGGETLPPSSGMTAVLSKNAHSLRVCEGIEEDDLDELSDAEAETLDHVWDMVGNLDQWQLVAWTHDNQNVPEWQDPNGSSVPIELEAIMAAVGVENAGEQSKILKRQYATDRKLRQSA